MAARSQTCGRVQSFLHSVGRGSSGTILVLQLPTRSCMQRIVRILALLLVAAAPALTQAQQPLRPVHTFSIVARDPQTGEIGVAVQSHWFAVGGEVPWARAGVGAVATQSFVDPSYGPRGLDLMAKGEDAQSALAQLLSDDKASNVRQVAFVDAKGNVGVWTGDHCIIAAGDHAGGGGPA